MPGSSPHQFWAWWPYWHLTTYKGLHVSKTTKVLHTHLLSNLLCQLSASPSPPTQPAPWYVQQKQYLGRQLLVPTSQKPFLNFILCFPVEKRRVRRYFPSLGKILHLFLKGCQCPKLLQFTQLQCLPISFTWKVSLLSRRNSITTWHCSWIHKTHFKGFKRALLKGHYRG